MSGKPQRRGGPHGQGKPASNQAKFNSSTGNALATRSKPQNQSQGQSQLQPPASATDEKDYELLANFFPVTLGNVSTIYEYPVGPAVKVKPPKSASSPETRPRHPKLFPLPKGFKASSKKERQEKVEQDQLFLEKFQAQQSTPGGQPDDPGHDGASGEELKLPKRMRRQLLFLLCDHMKANGVHVAIASDYDKCLLTVEPIKHEKLPGIWRVAYYDEDEDPQDPNLRQFDVPIGAAIETDVKALLDANGQISSNAPGDGSSASIGSAISTVPALLNPFFSHCANAYTRKVGQEPASVTSIGSNKYYLLDWTGKTIPEARRNPPWSLKDEANPTNVGGVEAMPGLFRSIRATIGNKLLLNINTTTSAFYKPGMLDSVLEEFGPGQPMYAINGFVKGLRVKTTYMAESASHKKKAIELRDANKKAVELRDTEKKKSVELHDAKAIPQERIYTIKGLPFVDFKPTASNVFFEYFPEGTDQPAEVTVQAYWRLDDKHQINLEDDDLIINCGRGGFIPAKFLKILPGQNYKPHTEMVSHACRFPRPNFKTIMEYGLFLFGIHPPDQNYSPAPRFSGLTVQKAMIHVPVVKLGPAQLQYGDGKTPEMAKVANGFWDLRGMRAFSPVSGKDYVVFELVRRGRSHVHPDHIRTFRRNFETALVNFGLSLKAREKDEMTGHRLTINPNKGGNNDELNLRTEFAKMKGAKISLAVILLPDNDPALYAQVKRAGDLRVGLHTVCHVLGTRSRPSDKSKGYWGPMVDLGTLANLVMKVNLKLGREGVNQVLPKPLTNKVLTSKTMIVGIDVTHPGPGSMADAPSVAAVVASVDENFAQCPASLRANPRLDDDGGKSMEQVVPLAEMIEERLLDFKAQRQTLPDRLVIYRDGLSEAQFDMCKNQELPKITKAINNVYDSGNAPKILLVCSVKRHHARFFDPGNAPVAIIDNNKNPRPGVAVFKTITYGQDKDFFLVSQKTIQGTARPCHYVVLHNELDDVAISDVAEATHHLCYLFGRATRSVGVATPSYYADLAADRARFYVRKWYVPDRGTTFNQQAFEDALRVHGDMKNSMFYI